MPSARRRPRRHVRIQTQKSAPGYSAKNHTEGAPATSTKGIIAMPNDTTIPSSSATPAVSPRVTADLDQSDLGDLVSLWTDWDRYGCMFPLEYLPEAIAALQALQAKLSGAQA